MVDLKTGEQKPLEAEMNQERSQFAVCVNPDESQIFVAGGFVNGFKATQQCERYSLKEKRWIPLPLLPEGKVNAGLICFDGVKLFALGGCVKNTAN